LLADIRREQVRTVYKPLDSLSAADLRELAGTLADEVTAQVSDGALPHERVVRLVAADLRYEGQTYELTINLDPATGTPEGIAGEFHKAHRTRYGHAFPESRVEIINLRAAAIGVLPERGLGTPAWNTFEATERSVYWGPDEGWLDTPVISRGRAEATSGLAGPLLIEQSDATIVVPPGVGVRTPAPGCLTLVGTGQGRTSTRDGREVTHVVA
jgi:N-methylhydantoinase A